MINLNNYRNHILKLHNNQTPNLNNNKISNKTMINKIKMKMMKITNKKIMILFNLWENCRIELHDSNFYQEINMK